MFVSVPSLFSCVQLFVTLWSVACQVPLSMGILQSRIQSGLPCPPQGDLPNPGIEPASLMSPALVAGGVCVCVCVCVCAMCAILYHVSHQGSLTTKIVKY